MVDFAKFGKVFRATLATGRFHGNWIMNYTAIDQSFKWATYSVYRHASRYG